MARQQKEQNEENQSGSDAATTAGDGRQERNTSERLRFLESLEKIDLAISGVTDHDEMISRACLSLLEILDCDRVSLLYPCNPEVDRARVEHEITKPGLETGNEGKTIPLLPEHLAMFRQMLATDKALIYGPGGDFELPEEAFAFLSMQSQIVMVLRPLAGDPWFFSIHQCDRPRRWSEKERRLVQEVGRRIADSLSILLILNDVRSSEARYRTLFERAADAILVHDGAAFS